MREKGFAHLILLIVIVVIGIGGIVYWNIKRNQNNGSTSYIPYLNNIYNYVSPYPTSSPTPTLDPVRDVEPTTVSQPGPEIDTLYYGLYDGKYDLFKRKKTLFLSNENARLARWEGEEGRKIRPYHGGILVFDEKYGGIADFRDIKNAKPIAITEPITDFYEPALSSDTYVYVFVVNQEFNNKIGPPDKFLLKIDTDTLTSEIIRRDNKEYPEANGGTSLESVIDNKYIVFKLWSCSECDGGKEVGKVIYNMFDKQEIFKENVGNLQFNLGSNTFTYQKLYQTTEKCTDADPYCFNGTKTVMKPSGQIYTETLP